MLEMGTSAGLENHNNELSPLECHSLCPLCVYECYACLLVLECMSYVQEYVDHILVINIRHGNIADGESVRAVILQRWKWGGRSERALLSHWDRLEGKNPRSMHVAYNAWRHASYQKL